MLEAQSPLFFSRKVITLLCLTTSATHAERWFPQALNLSKATSLTVL
jgi:hypothetical protein